MNIEYTGRHMVVTSKMKAQSQEGLERIEKVAHTCTSAHVILTEDKYRRIAEVTVSCSGEQLVATCEGKEIEAALHDALQKVEQQAIKHKKRVDTMRDHSKVAAEEAA